MNIKWISRCFGCQLWLQVFIVLLFLIGIAAESMQAFAEICATMTPAVICMEPDDIAKLVNPAAVRRLFVEKTPALQKAVLKDRVAIQHPGAVALTNAWNKTVSEVLRAPGKRDDFYRSVFEDMELQGLMKVRLDFSPFIRVSGLPNSPQVAFTMAGLRETFRFYGEAEPTQAELEKKLAEMNSFFQTEAIRTQFGKSFNFTPLIAEFVYQLRLNYRETKKQVIVFEDKPGTNSTEVDGLGTLYVPRSFFNAYDPIDQKLILVHEATHLISPAATWVMQLLTKNLGTMGPMEEVMGAPAVKERLRKTKMDMEYEQDNLVLLFFKSQPDMRIRYQNLIRRLAPSSTRASIIGFLNQHISTGSWPRPIIHLSLQDSYPAMQALEQYERLPNGPEKAAALIRVSELTLTSLPKQEQDFYKPLYQLIFKDKMQDPEELVHGFGLRPSPSETEILGEGLTIMFKEVLDRWQ